MCEAPAEGDGVSVHLAMGSADEGGEVVALIVVVKQIMAVLGMLCTCDSRRLVGTPRSEVGSLADEAVRDCDVGDNVGDVSAPVEVDVGAALRACSVGGGGGAGEGGGVVGPPHTSVGGNLSPHVEDVFVGLGSTIFYAYRDPVPGTNYRVIVILIQFVRYNFVWYA